MLKRLARNRRRLSDHFATLAQVIAVGQFGWTVATDPLGYGAAALALAALELVAVWIILLGEEVQ